MRTDRELLELAAKAAGMTGLEYTDHFLGDYYDPRGGEIGLSSTETISIWNPLINDGDALRLAVKLSIVLSPSKETVIAWCPGAVDRDQICEILHPYPEKATRRAIVLAAAEIGASMP